MKKVLFLAGFLALCSLLTTTHAQVKKVFLMGSSTIAGSGSTQDSSWAARLEAFYRKNPNDGLDTVFTNVGYPGYVTYKGMPTGYTPPSNPDRTGFQPDTYRNITRAIAENFDVVIISYVSNDVNLWPNYSKQETMNNLRTMYQQLTAAGIRTFVTSMQPRNDMNADQKLWLRELTDSITNNFGYYSINVYNELVTNDGTNSLRADLTADNIHPNNTGHRLIYQRVVTKQLFGPEAAPLPVRVSEFRGRHEGSGIRLSWNAASEDPGTSYEVQRSGNGRTYSAIATITGTAAPVYQYTDAQPGVGDNFYRLLIREPNRNFYSPIVKLNTGRKDLFIQGLQLSGNQLKLDVGAATNGMASLSIVSINGAEVLRKEVRINASGNSFQLPLDRLAPGEYVLTLRTATAQASQRFIRH